MKTVSQNTMQCVLILFGLMATPSALCQSNADFLDRIVFKDNQGLQVIPYTIAQLLIETCYDSREPVGIRCPSRETFFTATAKWAGNADYQTAINELAQREVLRSQLAQINGRSNNTLRVGVTSQQISMRQLSQQSSEAYHRHIAQLQTPGEVFARIVQGMFELNLDKTSGNEFVMNDDVVSLLQLFTDEAGKPLFSDSLERIAAAKRLFAMGTHYRFLKDEERWVVDGETKQWLKKNLSMEAAYLSLIENLGAAETRQVI
jgi:hypothetical protein